VPQEIVPPRTKEHPQATSLGGTIRMRLPLSVKLNGIDNLIRSYMSEILTTAQVADELLRGVNGGSCIAWVGSGISKPLYGDWLSSITCLCEACGVVDFGESTREPTADDLLDKAEECKKANEAAYESTLAARYGKEFGITRIAYDWLLRAPFRAFITTNVDPLLSAAGEVVGSEALRYYPELPSTDIERCKKSIFYMHGHARPNGIANGHNLVFARSDFEKAYGPSGVVRQFVEQLLTNYPIVFWGCQLQEPGIRESLQRVRDMHAQMKEARDGFTPPLRFAVLPTIYARTKGKLDQETEAAEAAEADYFRAIDIKVLRYDPRDRENHWEIEEILRSLCDSSSKLAVGAGEAGPK
jgi:hypothetical protein